MTGCAFRKCDNPTCAVCTVNERFPARVPCPRPVNKGRCRFVVGHPPPCRSEGGGKVEQATRDGQPRGTA